jgi:hypothetical protein
MIMEERMMSIKINNKKRKLHFVLIHEIEKGM